MVVFSFLANSGLIRLPSKVCSLSSKGFNNFSATAFVLGISDITADSNPVYAGCLGSSNSSANIAVAIFKEDV
jgi:hypothetical protein